MKNNEIDTLAKRIKFYRKKNNLSQELLADKMNVSQSTIAKWENGEQFPRSKNIKLLAQVLNTTSMELLNDFPVNYIDNTHAPVGTQTMTFRDGDREFTVPYDRELSMQILKSMFAGENISIMNGNNNNNAGSIIANVNS